MSGNEKIYGFLELAVNEYKLLEERIFLNGQAQPKDIEHLEKIYKVFSLALKRVDANEPDLYWRAPNLDYFLLLRQYAMLNDQNNINDILHKIHSELGLDGKYGFYEELKKVKNKGRSTKTIYLNPTKEMKEYKPLTEKLAEKLEETEHEEQPTELINIPIEELVKAA